MPEWLTRLEVSLGRRIVAVRLPMALFAFLLCQADLFARAGGGDSYDFAGGSEGGGSSGDGDIGDLLNLLFFLLNLFFKASPLGKAAIVITLLIAIGFYFLTSSTSRVSKMRSGPGPGLERQPERALENTLSALLLRDRNFNQEFFLNRVAIAFQRIQDAWSEMDLSKIRQFTSDGVHMRFGMQLEVMKACGLRNVTKDVQIEAMEIVEVESDWHYDAVHVRIRALACDYYVDAKGGVVYGDSSERSPFVEIWSFLRKPGVMTLTGQGLYENTCPNCGQPLDVIDSVACPSCKAVVNSGDYDWALAIITQEHLWSASESVEIPGLAELAGRDPDFNRRHLEDRTACMFYRYCASLLHASPTYLLKLSTAKFITSAAGLFQKTEEGKRKFIVDSAVGGVSTMWIKRAGNFDVAMVKVDWIGRWVDEMVPCELRPDFASARAYKFAFYLIRRQDVASSPFNKLNSIHCPNCGAPDSISDGPSCEYCRTPLNDGSQDWTLAAMLPYYEQVDVESILPG